MMACSVILDLAKIRDKAPPLRTQSTQLGCTKGKTH